MLLFVPYQDRVPGRLGHAPYRPQLWGSSDGSLHSSSCQLEGFSSCGGFAGTAVTVSQALVLYPHIFDFAPLAPFRGEGLGVRGFALRSDWVLGFASNALLCLEGLNKSLNRRFVADNSTPHPPGPLSPKRGEGEKIAGFSFDFK
jgi:hypothetical protein